jgi:hypothetical protein
MRIQTAIVGLALLPVSHVAAQPDFSRNTLLKIDLPGLTHDAVYDAARNTLYLGVRGAKNELIAVSTLTGEILYQRELAGQPRGMDLSDDGSRLYIALDTTAAVAEVNLDTRNVGTILVGQALGSARAWDVAEVNGALFVSSASRNSPDGFIARRDPSSGAWARAADGRSIDWNATFTEDPTGQYLFVGETMTPNRLYKLDAISPNATVVGGNYTNAFISGVEQGVVTADGGTLYLNEGQVVDVESLVEIGRINQGYVALTPDEQYAITGDRGFVRIHRTSDFSLVDEYAIPPVPFESFTTRDFDLVNNGTGFAYLDNLTLYLNIPAPAGTTVLLGAMPWIASRRRR